MVVEALSRRDFLKRIGRGAAAAVAVPWTKLLSAPELAAKVAAPFKIGAGSMVNPQALFKYYSGQFKDRVMDSGITLVDAIEDQPTPIDTPATNVFTANKYFNRTQMDARSVNWVTKGMVDMYAGGKLNPHDEATIAPTVAMWDNMIGHESLLEDPNFPDWAKDLLARGMAHSEAEDEEPGSGKMSDEDFKRFETLMDSSYFDEDPAGEVFDYEQEEMEDMLKDRTGAPDNVKWRGSLGPSQEGDTIDVANGRPGKFPEQWQFMIPSGSKKNELIGSVFDYIISLEREGIGFDELRAMNFEREFLPGVGNYVKRMVVAYQALAKSDAQQTANSDDQKAKAKDDDERGEVPSRHPYGVGSPQSGLQTASTKPTFKEFFNGRYRDAQD